MSRDKDRFLNILLISPSILAIFIFVYAVYRLVCARISEQMERLERRLHMERHQELP